MCSRETFPDLDCSSSEEEINRAAPVKTSPGTRRHHPFSVEALMSGRKADGEAPSTGSVKVSPAGWNSFCRQIRGAPGGSRKSPESSPSSPIKSEASESEDCAPWVNTAFSTHTRKCVTVFSVVNRGQAAPCILTWVKPIRQRLVSFNPHQANLLKCFNHTFHNVVFQT